MQYFGRIGRVLEPGGPLGQMGKFFKIDGKKMESLPGQIGQWPLYARNRTEMSQIGL